MKKTFLGKTTRAAALIMAVILLVSGVSFADTERDALDSGGLALTDVRLLDEFGNDLSAAGAVDAGAPVTLEYTYAPPVYDSDSGDALAASTDAGPVPLAVPTEIDLTDAAFSGAAGKVLGPQTAEVASFDTGSGNTFRVRAKFDPAACVGEKTLEIPLSGRSKRISLRFTPQITTFDGTIVAEDFDFLTGVQLLRKEGNKWVALQESDEMKRTENVAVKYTYNKQDGDIEKETVAYTFLLPKQIYIDSNLRLNIVEERDGNDVTVGTGRLVDQQSNKVEIIFNAENQTNHGEFWFYGNFNGNEIANDGKQEIDFSVSNSSLPKIPVNFEIDPVGVKLKVEKSGKLSNLTNKEITWTITVTPELTNLSQAELSNWTITDTIPQDGKSLAYQNAVLKDPTIGTGFQASYVDPTLICTMPDMTVTNGQKIQIEVVTKFDDRDFATATTVNYLNTAKTNFSYKGFEMDGDKPKKDADGKPIPKTLEGTEATSNEAKVSITSGEISKEGMLSATNEITWTIHVKNPLKIQNPKIKDTLPEGLSLNSAPQYVCGQKLTENSGGSPAANEYTYNASTRELICCLDNGKFNSDGEASVTFVTTINQDKWNGVATFQNKASYQGIGNGWIESKEASVNLGTTLLGKSGTYDRTNHTITWKLAFGKDGVTLPTPITVTDVIPEGLRYLTTTNDGGGTAIYDDNTKTLTVTFGTPGGGGSVTGERQILFTTEVIDPAIWATNQTSRSFNNTATLFVNGMSPISTGTVNVQTPSEMLKKDFVTYDATKWQAEWKLTVNQNEMELNNGVITDTLPEDWKFVEEGFETTFPGLTADAIEHDGKNPETLTIRLPKMEKGKGNGNKTITYRMELTNKERLKTTEPFQVGNKATLIAEEIPEASTVESEAKGNVTLSLVEKSGQANNADWYIQWEVYINRNKLEMLPPTLEDMIADSLRLDPYSIELYKVQLKPDGTENPADRELQSPNTYKVEIDGQKFTFAFQAPIADAYLLRFKTDIREAMSGNVSNDINLKGGDIDVNSKSASVAVNVQSAGGSTGRKKGSIEILKTDNGTPPKPLKDAYFSVDGGPRKATEENGRVTFTDIPVGSHTVVEMNPPEGYVGDSFAQTVQVKANETTKLTVTNRPIKCTVEIVKTGEGSEPLPDAEIDLFRKSLDAPYSHEKAFRTGKSGTDGKIIFADLPYGEYFYREATPPDGYLLDSTLHLFNVMDEEPMSLSLVNRKIPPAPTPDNSGSGGSGGSGSGSGSGSGGSSPSGNGILTPPSNSVEPGKPADPAIPADQPPADSTTREETPRDTPKEGAFDAPGDSHYVLLNPPEKGVVEIRTDGTWHYTPAPGFSGEDSFTVEIRLPGGETRTERVLVTILDEAVPKSPPNTGKYE